MCDALDKFFILLFARYRRRVGDAQIEAAWRRACSDVWWASALVSCSLVVVGIFALYALTGIGTPKEHQQWVLYGGIGSYVMTIALLRRRFRKFLVDVPQITTTEFVSDTRYVRLFRIMLYSIGGAIVIAIWVLRKQHLAVLRGF